MTEPTAAPRPPTALDLLRQALASAARMVHDDRRFGRGDRAQLRRMKPGGVPPEPYWRVVQHPTVAGREEDDDFWMAVLPEMTRHPHDPKVRPGAALHEAGVSERRIERWLAHDRARALRGLHNLLSQLRSAEGLDWRRLGVLLMYWDASEHDAFRRSFARDYYRARARAEAPSDEEE